MRRDSEEGGPRQENAALEVEDFESSVELLEQVLMSKLQLYGPGAEEVFDTCEQLTLAYNTLAMKLIDRYDFYGAHELLKKA